MTEERIKHMSKKLYGIDWLKSKLMPDDVSVNGEADLSAWKPADWKKIASRCLTAHDWSELLKLHPQVANQCEWGMFSGLDWRLLLIGHPEFACYCDWEKLDNYDWWARSLARRSFRASVRSRLSVSVHISITSALTARAIRTALKALTSLR